jgi:hypothetical protein
MGPRSEFCHAIHWNLDPRFRSVKSVLYVVGLFRFTFHVLRFTFYPFKQELKHSHEAWSVEQSHLSLVQRTTSSLTSAVTISPAVRESQQLLGFLRCSESFELGWFRNVKFYDQLWYELRAITHLHQSSLLHDGHIESVEVYQKKKCHYQSICIVWFAVGSKG